MITFGQNIQSNNLNTRNILYFKAKSIYAEKNMIISGQNIRSNNSNAQNILYFKAKSICAETKRKEANFSFAFDHRDRCKF
jgi:hypothetical protein